MPNSSLVQLATGLPPNPAPRQLQPLARAIAERAMAKSVPARSIKQFVQIHLPHIDEAGRAQVRSLAGEYLAEMLPPEAAEAPPLAANEWVSLDEAAIILGLPKAWIQQKLAHPEYRRMWGWPRCIDGKQWRFARSAIGTASAGDAPHFSAVEPPHFLPSWCKRVDEVDTSCKSPVGHP